MSKKKKEGSSWGLVLSLLLHGSIILLVLVWGIKKYTATDISQPINISLSSLDYKGSSDKPGDKLKAQKAEAKEKEQQEPEAENKEEEKKEEVKKEEPKKEIVEEEKKEDVKKEEVAVKEEPEKEEKKVEEKKEEPKKEEVKKEPDKKIVALETEKKEPKKEVKEESKKQPTKEVVKKVEKPQKKEDEDQVARKNVINELKRKNVISKLRRDETLSELKGAEDSAGLKGSDNEDVLGSPGKVNTALLNVYNNAIWRKIKPRFRIPPNIPTDGSLTASIFFKIDDKGNVSGVKVKESSGNPAFDNFCINTIISSSPLPPPPSDIAKLVISQGFEIPLKNEEG